MGINKALERGTVLVKHRNIFIGLFLYDKDEAKKMNE